MEQVTISVIVPVYNRAEMVAEALRSAVDAFGDIPGELVIVDDASTDGTWDVLQALANARMTVARCRRTVVSRQRAIMDSASPAADT